MKLSQRTRQMAQTIQFATIVIVLMLLLQLTSGIFFAIQNAENTSALRENVRSRFVGAVQQYYQTASSIQDRLARFPVILELQYRDEITYNNFEKQYRLINQIEEIYTANAKNFEIFIYFPRSGKIYNHQGALTNDAHLSMLKDTFSAFRSDGVFLANAAIPASSGTYHANLLSYQTDSLQIVIACPLNTLAERVDATLENSYAVAVARNVQGDVIACSSALLALDAKQQDALSSQYEFVLSDSAGFSVEMGYDQYAPNKVNERSNSRLAVTTTICLLLIAAFLYLFARKVYSPLNRILSKLDIDEASPGDGEFLRIDTYITNTTAHLAALKRQMREHDDIIFDNTLNKLAQELQQVAPRSLSSRQHPFFSVITLVSEDEHGELNIEGARSFESALGAHWHVRPFYRFDRQLSYYIEMYENDWNLLLETLRAIPSHCFIAVAVSSLKSDLSQLRSALEESRKVLMSYSDPEATACRWLCAYDPAYPGADMPNISAREETQLVNAVLKGDEEAMLHDLQTIFAKRQALPLLCVRELCVYLLNLLHIYRREDHGIAGACMEASRRITDIYNITLLPAIVTEQYDRAVMSIFEENQIFHAVTEFIHANYASPELSLQLAADHVGMSYSYLSKQFKQVTGSCFSEYLSAVRIEEAKRLLTETNDPVGEIALKVGFDIVSSFSRAFKKYAGIPPVEHRRLHAREA